MGLLSFRDIAIGAGEAYLDKRQEARKNIIDFSTRAFNKAEELKAKYQEGYEAKKKKADDFKFVATRVGETYLPQLNSFMNQGGQLEQFNDLDISQVKNILDEPQYKEKQEDFLPTLAQQNKLSAEDLNKDLQNQLNIFNNTASVFTKDIITRGVEGVRADVGTIKEQDIDTRVAVGPGVQTSTQPTIADINKNKNTYEKTKTVTEDDFGNETVTNSPTTDAIDNIVVQNRLAGEISGNVLNDDLYLNSAVESYGNPNYTDAVTENYQVAFDKLITEYNSAKSDNNRTQMQSVVNALSQLGFNNKANELQTEINQIASEAGADADDMQEEQITAEPETREIKVKGKVMKTVSAEEEEEPKKSSKGIPFLKGRK
tara:strand:- start:3768 stop:4886 length:1119 start_codon:yes stop_codon:yes gene_type:complete